MHCTQQFSDSQTRTHLRIHDHTRTSTHVHVQFRSLRSGESYAPHLVRIAGALSHCDVVNVGLVVGVSLRKRDQNGRVQHLD